MKFLFLFAVFIFNNAYAEDILVLYTKGKVSTSSSTGKEESLKRGDFVIEGETIKTAENSFAIVKIGNHSTHRIEEKSEVLVEKLPYEFENSSELEQGGSFFLKLGTVFSEIFKKSDDESFRIHTHYTTLGVRGTKLMASIDHEHDDTWVTVGEGTVEVHNKLTNASDLVVQDQSMVIEKDKNFTQQHHYEWQKNLRWNIEKRKEDFKSFRNQRLMAYKEFHQRKANWVRNEARWGQFKKQREEKLLRYKDKIKKLRRNQILKKREQLHHKTLKLQQKKQSFYKKRLLKKNEGYSANSFANKARRQTEQKQEKRKEELQKLREKRRRLRK